MSAPKCVTIDFETKGIQSRPEYPPVPVGMSIQEPGKKPRYYAWGHPTKNNCTKAEAIKVLKKFWNDPTELLLFYNSKFDVDVAQTHMECGRIAWNRIHDAMYVMFLIDPHAMSLQLKPMAKKHLGIEPEERDLVKEWVLANVPERKKKKSDWGEHMWKAPGNIMGDYANGDTFRTTALFNYMYPKVVKLGMRRAYDRERQLMLIFLENERRGLRVDLKALKRDIPIYQGELAKSEVWLRKRLKVDKDFNFDSDADLAEALNAAGIVTEWELTKTGKKSTSKKVMTIEKFNNKKLFLVLGYRNRLTTCLRIFMEPWYAKGKKAGGFILPTWNQVRQPKGDGDSRGTRTGRPSCEDPNLLNLAKSFEDRGDDYTHPTFANLLPLPLVRRYILPDKGCVWLHRDYNQQELRILAHFEDGAILKAYKADPRMDIHTFVQEEIQRVTGISPDRVSVKTMNFGKIYGQGLHSLSIKLRRPQEEVEEIRNAQNKALPGLPTLEKDIKKAGKAGKAIKTWGGRIYFCEPPRWSEKFRREMTFEYKLLNYLVQGSAADATKEAIIRYYYHPKRKGRFLVTVYDEINICVEKKWAKHEMQVLQECMEGLELDVPLLTDGKIGNSWGELKKVA